MEAIFQLFSYFPCKLDVVMLVVIYKIGISRRILDIDAGCCLERKSLFWTFDIYHTCVPLSYMHVFTMGGIYNYRKMAILSPKFRP
jgi:hypothetical protein